LLFECPTPTDILAAAGGQLPSFVGGVPKLFQMFGSKLPMFFNKSKAHLKF
jgi:hypothetical protein